MAIYKRGKVYWYEFEFNGDRIRESTKQGNDKVARQMESAHRTALAKGEVGIRDLAKAPSLRTFLEKEFTPYVESAHTAKPATAVYYKRGIAYLSADSIADLRIDEITNQHGAQFIARHKSYSASTVNVAMRTLRRAMYLAEEWGKLKAAPQISIAKGEKMRTRVLSAEEKAAYLAHCAQPCRDIALMMLETGMRPSEVLGMTWDRVALSDGVLRINNGKTEAAKRQLPITATLHEALASRWQAAGRPETGFLFPSPYKSDSHIVMPYAAHYEALEASGVEDFVPYTQRHTALTELATVCDPFTLKTIAGHTSITTTQRYVHPQAEAIQTAFERRGKKGPKLVAA